MLPRWLLVAAALSSAPLATTLILALGPDPVAQRLADPLVHGENGFVGSTTCRACHPDHHASWADTFHSTMTQRATPETVLGPFDGREITFEGRTGKVRRDGDRFLMDVPLSAPEQGLATREVALTVGSRRYQQYFERVEQDGGVVFKRLPLLWHLEAGRWMHLNGVFLEPDNPDWDQHRATWNQNCIFCHNTGVQPGAHDPLRLDTSFDSTVAEVGIACETCHGPGAEHVAKHDSALDRWTGWAEDPEAAPAITDPSELDQARQLALCGQCHGQRLPDPRPRINDWLTTGPTFRPGDLLTSHVEPIRIDTPSLRADQPELFRQRFWADGTPRLTAYEFQGVTSSPCAIDGPMTCASCHTMHGGDPHGMIEPELRGDRACTQCHDEYSSLEALEAHTHHSATSSGSRCLDCHMPRMIYGILDVHRSHKIEVPDVRRDVEAGRPNACTLCHLDWSPLQAATEAARLWGGEPQLPRSRPDGVSLDVSDAVASLLAGDAVQRVVFAKAFGRTDTPRGATQRAVDRAVLAATLSDAYPSIRWRAEQSLRALEATHPTGILAALATYDVYADTEARKHATFGVWDRISQAEQSLRAPESSPFVGPDLRVDSGAIVALLQLQSRRVISIGE